MNTTSQENDSMAKGDMLVNNLIYRQPQQLSLAVNRTMKRQRFQLKNYDNGDTATINWNTGSDYVKQYNSYLTFTVKLTGTDTPTANFGVGSALNVLETLIINTKSGAPLDRIERLNLLSAKQIRHQKSQDWIDNFGTMIGMTPLGTEDTAILNTSGTKFIIPLNLLSGLFNPVGGHLFPPHLAAGLEMIIKFADYRTALVQKSGTVTGYTINDISIMTDNITLSDDTQKSLNFESASSGLEYTYPRFHTATSAITSTSINVQMAKSVAQASTLTATIIDNSVALNVTVDSLKSAVWDVTSWSVRLGSLYFPNETLTDAAVDGVESYFISQAVNDKSKFSHAENSISVADFKDRHAIISASFERDQALNLSGVAVNNSRQIEVSATLQALPGTAHQIVVFLEYSAVAKAFIDNCSISI